MTEYHVPVMAREAIDLLEIDPRGTYVDLTFGGGGHSRLILSALGPKGRLFSFDQDGDAKQNIPDDGRFCFVESNFRFLRPQLRLRGVEKVDGILADLGVSSHHFDTAERGFSFRFDAPLDMRMNRGGTFTARNIVTEYDSGRLTALLRDYGEVPMPHKAAGCILKYRKEGVIETVGDLIAAVEPCTPRKDSQKYLSKLFQALRIEVNREMESLKMALEQSLRVLSPGGRLVVISYHSLEDRLVKNFIRNGNFSGVPEKDFFGRVQTPFEALTRKALVPGEEEVARNPRSRSAKLRAAIKNPDKP